MQEDVLLVHQTLSGDEKAYHRLFRKYQKAIYARILSMVQNPADAEELTADVFIKAYQNLSSLRQPGRFFWWVVRIARNHSQNWLQRHQTPFLSLEDVPVGELPSTNSAEDELLRQERYQKVLEALDTLPDVDRELMKGFYFEGASYDALQKRHGLSKKAVAMRLVKARRKVREKVEKMLSGMVVFPWRDFLEKLFLGGMQVVKLSATTKLVTVWTATLLMLGGIITVSVWHDKSSKQFMSKQVITQASQETPQKTSGYLLSKQKPSVTPVQKSANQTPATDSVQAKQTGDADLNSFWAELAALEAGSETDYVEISTETAENEVSSEPTP
ncbi:MAG: sigma-70 family RNA polymerase sigma factor, partial [Deltaproteobacteria bacterium]|nr:sigma-70 family RNA polymerase sigma factor [Deltaproteobacteria bacterium]